MRYAHLIADTAAFAGWRRLQFRVEHQTLLEVIGEQLRAEVLHSVIRRERHEAQLKKSEYNL